MTKFRSRSDGSHYPINHGRSTGTMSKGTAHLGVPKFRQNHDSAYYRSKAFNARTYKQKAKFYAMAERANEKETKIKQHIIIAHAELADEAEKTGNWESAKNHRQHILEMTKDVNAAVKDEKKGYEEYMKMAAVAEKEGRFEDAKVFRSHAADEKRHELENKVIIEENEHLKFATEREKYFHKVHLCEKEITKEVKNNGSFTIPKGKYWETNPELSNAISDLQRDKFAKVKGNKLVFTEFGKNILLR